MNLSCKSIQQFFQRADGKGLVALLSVSLLLSLTLINPLRATQRMVLGEELTNTS